MRSALQQLIERCRRQQQQVPGQLEIPDVPSLFDPCWHEYTEWATEEEALDEWRTRMIEYA